MKFIFSKVYRVTQKYFYAPPYTSMRDLRHNSDNGDLELVTPHVLINTWQDLEYRLDQRFPTFLTRGALFRINFYGGAP